MRRERGSVSTLIAALAGLVVAMVYVGAAATSVYMQHRHVLTLADSLADTIAYGYDRGTYYTVGGSDPGLLTDASVAARAKEVLGRVPAEVLATVPDTRVEAVRVIGEHRIEVRMSARAQVPFVPGFLSEAGGAIPFVVTSQAEIGFEHR